MLVSALIYGFCGVKSEAGMRLRGLGGASSFAGGLPPPISPAIETGAGRGHRFSRRRSALRLVRSEPVHCTVTHGRSKRGVSLRYCCGRRAGGDGPRARATVLASLPDDRPVGAFRSGRSDVVPGVPILVGPDGALLIKCPNLC